MHIDRKPLFSAYPSGIPAALVEALDHVEQVLNGQEDKVVSAVALSNFSLDSDRAKGSFVTLVQRTRSPPVASSFASSPDTSCPRMMPRGSTPRWARDALSHRWRASLDLKKSARSPPPRMQLASPHTTVRLATMPHGHQRDWYGHGKECGHRGHLV